MCFLSSFSVDDNISITSFIQCEDSFGFDSNVALWVPQQGLIHVEFDLLDLEDIIKYLSYGNHKELNLTKDDLLTEISELNFHGKVLPPRITLQEKK